MLTKLAQLFRRRQSDRVSMDHPDLGRLVFDPDACEWETAEGAPVYHGGLPGNQGGPDPSAVADILERLRNIERYWQACSDDLLSIASSYSSLPRASDPRQIFRVSALSLYPQYWELCFQTLPEHKWLYVGMQFEGEQLVSNTIDT